MRTQRKLIGDGRLNGINRIQFTYEFVEKTHDSLIVVDNGWEIVIGRGLNIYQKTNG